MFRDKLIGSRLDKISLSGKGDGQDSKKMCIAVFVSAFPALSETFIVNQLVELKKAGHLVHIYAQTKAGEQMVHPAITENSLINDTIYLDSLPRKRGAKILLLFQALLYRYVSNNWKLFFSFLTKAPKHGLSVYDFLFYCRKPVYDVVHAHFGINGNYVVKLKQIGLFSGSRFVTTFHGYDMEVLEKNFYSQLFRVCDLVITNSDYSIGKLLRLGCPTGKLVKVPVGLDVGYFEKEAALREPNDCFTILFVGRLVRFKGPDLVIWICDGLRQKGLRFRAIFVGDGEMREELEDMINEFSLKEEVKLLGPKTQSDVRKLMAEADVFLLPGRTVNGRAENQGLVIQEAQAMGLPVIVSDMGGMKEGIIDKETGFVLPDNNIKAFVEKIEWLANNPDVRKRMGVSGREFVVNRYNSKIINQDLVNLYQD